MAANGAHQRTLLPLALTSLSKPKTLSGKEKSKRGVLALVRWTGFPEAQKPRERTGLKTAECRASRSLSTGCCATTTPDCHCLPQAAPLEFFPSPSSPWGWSSWELKQGRCSAAPKLNLKCVDNPTTHTHCKHSQATRCDVT